MPPVAILLGYLLGVALIAGGLVWIGRTLESLPSAEYAPYVYMLGGAVPALMLGGFGIGYVLIDSPQFLQLIAAAGVLIGGVLVLAIMALTGILTIQELRGSQQELNQRERELEWLYEVTEVLNRTLRHNVRNDLNVIQGQTENIRDTIEEVDDEEVDEAKDHIDEILTQAQDLVTLADSARDLHEAVNRDIQREISYVDELIMNSVATVRRRYPDATIEVEGVDGVEVATGPLFQTALEHLLDNAIRHNTGSAAVTVTCEQWNSEVKIDIEDDGPGIPEYELSVIEQDIETPLRHGSGIGLWLSNWIVDQYGGDLTFHTDGSEGTTARIRLPAAAGEEETIQRTASPGTPDSGEASGA